MRYKDIELQMTCGACPEQYDAYYKGKMIGYLRLRHGHFRVDYPGVNGECIYSAQTVGDGIFEDSERDKYLKRARMAIMKAYENDK